MRHRYKTLDASKNRLLPPGGPQLGRLVRLCRWRYLATVTAGWFGNRVYILARHRLEAAERGIRIFLPVKQWSSCQLLVVIYDLERELIVAAGIVRQASRIPPTG
jgi:hypothetical protein